MTELELLLIRHFIGEVLQAPDHRYVSHPAVRSAASPHNFREIVQCAARAHPRIEVSIVEFVIEQGLCVLLVLCFEIRSPFVVRWSTTASGQKV